MAKGPTRFQARPPAPPPADGRHGHVTNGTRAPRPSSRQGKKVVSVFIEPKAWRRLRVMALEEDTTTQALGLEAINMLFAARGKGPAA